MLLVSARADAPALSGAWEKALSSIPAIPDLVTAGGLILDVAGVFVILFGAVAATSSYLLNRRDAASFPLYRKSLGRAILLGLEFMVGGDIVRTVSVEHPSIDNVLVLGMIVLIRTILGWSMQVEIEGRWPWRGSEIAADAGRPADEPSGFVTGSDRRF
ncbi:DUF1622 domain-containing protein [Methylocapsa palsarum]|uniref:Uncharacterized membrane protein n=1 Tax=Methylocapsa palsarum TaxID=1612308 RepID=A0A1I3Z1K5_9HYPH|nr:DUF1622 domain-containing protein [Methylocapsa palsarum]SFK37983.1 Uncharacterized membrane protein [Methylocapsa palsarum]